MAEWIISTFTDKGVPKTGLTPTIKIWEIASENLVVNGDTMDEISTSGNYKYSFTTIDNAKEYITISDGGTTLNNKDRYHSAVIDSGSETVLDDIRLALFSKKYLKKIDDENMHETIYESDGVTPFKEFDLSIDDDGNQLREPL